MIQPQRLVGKQIDQFRVDEYVARGAMGMVFKAYDTVLTRTVALKLISKAVSEDMTAPETALKEEARKRLIQEAKAAGRLTHPNIVTVHSYGETEDHEYICMEFIAGRTLAQVLAEKGCLEPPEALPIFEQILEALVAANEERIVHRDIKPSNIMITTTNRVKVMDFGIAKLPSFSMTMTGAILGTPYYMSPEQIMGEDVDIRSDLFSLGAVLYQTLTGEKPFEGQNTATITYRIMNLEPPSLTERKADIPPFLSAIVQKALAKDPNRRYQVPDEMLGDIRQAKEAVGSTGGTPGGTWSGPGARGGKGPFPPVRESAAGTVPVRVEFSDSSAGEGEAAVAVRPGDSSLNEDATWLAIPPVERGITGRDAPGGAGEARPGEGIAEAGSSSPRKRPRWPLAAPVAMGIILLLGVITAVVSFRKMGSAPSLQAPSGETAERNIPGESRPTSSAPEDQKGGTTQEGAPIPSTAATKLEGGYFVKGISSSGAAYRGTAVIERKGDAYTLTWKLGNEAISGNGVLSGNTLTVNWSGKAGSGVIAYTVMPDGTLKGTWAGGSGSETLVPIQ